MNKTQKEHRKIKGYEEKKEATTNMASLPLIVTFSRFFSPKEIKE